MNTRFKHLKLHRRHRRVRAKIIGTKTRPRLSVFRSSQHVHLQLIDDEAGRTLASASTLEVKNEAKDKTGKAAAAAKLLVNRALQAGIKTAVFDRGGRKYHGRVKAAAEAAREAGLKI